MSDEEGRPEPVRGRARHPSHGPLWVCLGYYCAMGLVFLTLDLAQWAPTGRYESPSLWGLYALEWLAWPGIALAGGAALVSASSTPRRPWGVVLSLFMLLVYAWIWDLSHFLAREIQLA